MKKILLTLVTLVVLNLKGTLVANAVNGPLTVAPQNPRYFTDNSGQIVFLTGAHTWRNFQAIGTDNFDFTQYLNYLKTNNLNFMRLWIWETDNQAAGFGSRTISPLPFIKSGSKYDLNSWDQTFFDRLRQHVIAAGNQDIYVSIQLFNGWSVGDKGSGNPYVYHPFNVTKNINGINGDPNSDGNGYEIETLAIPAITTIQDAYVKKVIDSVNDLDNVLYEICNESQGDTVSVAWQNHMIDLIHSYEATKPKQHPVGFTVPYPNGNNSWLFNSNADWIAPNDGAGYKDNPPANNGSKVIISDTDHLWGLGGDRDWVWKSLTRGLMFSYMDCYAVPGSLEQQLNCPISYNDTTRVSLINNLGYARSLTQQLDLMHLTPQNNLASTGYILADPGSEYLVYQPSSGSFTVILAAGTYTVEWFNPSSGVKTSATNVTGGITRTMTPPFSGDAVLILRSTAMVTPTTAALSPTPGLLGDLDGDSDIDFLDLRALILHFGSSSLADLNFSGLVDIFDFNRLLNNFSPQPPTTPSPSPIPSVTPTQTGTTYYISPTGSDSNTGNSNSSPWATFTYAFTQMTAGDTLLLMDGTYPQTIEPQFNGTSQKPVTVKALNDGQAIIDGDGQRHTVIIGQSWDYIPNATRDTPNPYGNYFLIEGIVAKDSVADVFEIYARNVTLRRVSGYNANPHDNFHVITVWTKGSPQNPSNILVEDSVAAGSGRKMIIDYDSYVNVVFRRNFVAWQWWLGDQFCQSYWPQSQGIENYPAAYQDQPVTTRNDLRENNISFGLAPDSTSSFSPNPGYRYGNQILGEVALGTGMKWNNTTKQFVSPYFNATACQYNGTDVNHTKPTICGTDTRCISTSSELGKGFVFATFSNPSLNTNLVKDLFSAFHGDVGFVAGPWGTQYGSIANNQLVDATIVHNGLGSYSPNQNLDVDLDSLTRFSIVQNLKIGNLSGGSNPSPGIGASIQYRYHNGTLTTESLWPWPMEDRIKSEFADPTLFQANGNTGEVWENFSVTETVCNNILVPNGAVPALACP